MFEIFIGLFIGTFINSIWRVKARERLDYIEHYQVFLLGSILGEILSPFFYGFGIPYLIDEMFQDDSFDMKSGKWKKSLFITVPMILIWILMGIITWLI